MRVLLSGTSNSIIVNGISAAFEKEQRITSFVNASHGASGVVGLANHCRKIDFSKYDFCLLDYCVNEEIFVQTKVTEVASSINHMDNAISEASKAGCQPIIIIFPSVTRLNYPRPFEEEIYRRYQSLGVPIFNFYHLCFELLQQGVREFSDFFLDPAHIHHQISYSIGETICDYMSAIQAKQVPRKIVQSDHRYSKIDFINCRDLSCDNPRPIIHRETRITSSDFLPLEPGDTFSVHYSQDAVLRGVAYNVARSVGSIINPINDEILFQVDINPCLLYTSPSPRDRG